MNSDDIEQLSQKFLNLWQEQLAKALIDPLLQRSCYEMMSRFQTLVNQKGDAQNSASESANGSTKDEQSEEARQSQTLGSDDQPFAIFMGDFFSRIQSCEGRFH